MLTLKRTSTGLCIWTFSPIDRLKLHIRCVSSIRKSFEFFAYGYDLWLIILRQIIMNGIVNWLITYFYIWYAIFDKLFRRMESIWIFWVSREKKEYKITELLVLESKKEDSFFFFKPCIEKKANQTRERPQSSNIYFNYSMNYFLFMIHDDWQWKWCSIRMVVVVARVVRSAYWISNVYVIPNWIIDTIKTNRAIITVMLAKWNGFDLIA